MRNLLCKSPSPLDIGERGRCPQECLVAPRPRQLSGACDSSCVDITEGMARRYVATALSGPQIEVIAPVDSVSDKLPEVQNAIRAALNSTDSALAMGQLMNRFLKLADGKSQQGLWVPQAVDSLRAALLFASAGLDTSLKRLVRHALPQLASSDHNVQRHFRKWAEQRVGDSATGAVQAKELVLILLGEGASPRDVLMGRWVYELTDGSAQSVERVDELAQALGVTDREIRSRTASKDTSTLKSAFTARNEIAHELDVTDPEAEVRKPLENIRRYRKATDIRKWCNELLDVTQQITNDVAARLL